MKLRRPEVPARSYVGRRDPSSVPAKTCHKTMRLIISMAAIPIVAIVISSGDTALAESGTTVLPKTAAGASPYANFVREAAQRFGVPASWIGAVMAIESGGDVLALSPRGAMGLMQVMPETWAGLRARHGLGDNPYDPRDNILAGAAYLRELHERYGSPGFLAAYNAGPGRYDDHLATGRALPYETQLYVATLAPLIGQRQDDDIVTASRRIGSWHLSGHRSMTGLPRTHLDWRHEPTACLFAVETQCVCHDPASGRLDSSCGREGCSEVHRPKDPRSWTAR